MSITETAIKNNRVTLLILVVLWGCASDWWWPPSSPPTMLTTLLLISSFDIGLDQISIASLIIALGMLVDNAIVMSESIMVQMAAGTACGGH